MTYGHIFVYQTDSVCADRHAIIYFGCLFLGNSIEMILTILNFCENINKNEKMACENIHRIFAFVQMSPEMAKSPNQHRGMFVLHKCKNLL